MEPSIPVAFFLLLFAATHIGLGEEPVRGPLVARFGRWGFTWCFMAVAAVTFGLGVSYYALHQAEGAPGLDLGRFEVARSVLVGVTAVGVMLMAASFASYDRSPMALGGDEVREPYGIERVTRHPFFVGVFLLGASHALLATRLVGAVTMGGLAVFVLVGAKFQDLKLLARYGSPYADYLAGTSTLPFAAIASGRQRLVWRELPAAAPLIGLVLAYLLSAVHAQLFDHAGAYVIGGLVGLALLITLQEWRRERRAGAPPTTRATA